MMGWSQMDTTEYRHCSKVRNVLLARQGEYPPRAIFNLIWPRSKVDIAEDRNLRLAEAAEDQICICHSIVSSCLGQEILFILFSKIKRKAQLSMKRCPRARRWQSKIPPVRSPQTTERFLTP